MKSGMTVYLDGMPRELAEGTTLKTLLEGLGEPYEYALVERNGVFVHAREYGLTRLAQGDRVEVIYPAFGG